MSGELRTSQFRWTTTANSDFVIGSPDDVGSYPARYLVFQTSTTPGYAANPHFMCDHSRGSWELKINSTPGGGYLSLTDAAYKSDNNTFSGSNVFNTGTFTVNSPAYFNDSFSSTGVFEVVNYSTASISSPTIDLGNDTSGTILLKGSSTFNSPVTMQSDLSISGSLTVSGTSSSLDTINLTVRDKLITINKGSSVNSANGSGIEVQENLTISGYIKIGNNRSSWEILTPAKPGTIQFTPGPASFNMELVSSATANRVITFPNATGTLALTSDINLVYTAGRALQTNASTGVAEVSSITNTQLNYLSGVTSNIQTQFGNYVSLAGSGETITGNKVFRGSIQFDTFSGGPNWQSFPLVTYGDTTGATGIRSTVYTAYYMNFISGDATTATYDIFMGVNGVDGRNGANSIKLRRTSSKVSMELASNLSSGSSLILVDRITGTRYELYVNSGVLTIATAP